jgi:hypothetical protein
MNNFTGETRTRIKDRNFNSINNSCSSDSLDEIEEAERYKVFLREYFHKQFLRMQALYPPSFKSKLSNSMLRNVNKSTSYYTQKTAFKNRKNISTLSDIIINSLEKLGILHFNGGVNGWVSTDTEE